ADFLNEGLFDPAFVTFDPNSTTPSMQPNARDLTYSVYRPDLAVLGARDGFMPSGLPISNNDALSRRDMGLEFLDVTPQVRTELMSSSSLRGGRQQEDVYRITNNSSSIIDTHLLVIVQGLPNRIAVDGSSMTRTGSPYLRVFLPDGVLLPGQSMVQRLRFNRHPLAPRAAGYALTLMSGQGNP
ncbi:MAG: hypothetical protein H7039_20575, partial [Bryobacteraceae bacterium]|nr:hypothetical protein [Bryobacteraceae bacterium]